MLIVLVLCFKKQASAVVDLCCVCSQKDVKFPFKLEESSQLSQSSKSSHKGAAINGIKMSARAIEANQMEPFFALLLVVALLFFQKK